MKWILNKEKAPSLIDKLLLKRGVSLDRKKKFLEPQLTDLYDPFLLPDMKKAITLFKKHLNKSSKVAIFADYDADGITGAVLMSRLFEELKLDYEAYIPNRDEGYGLSKKAIDYLLSKDIKLLFTIDCGIANHQEIKYAREKGLEIIILDHHEPKKDLPPAQAVVDGKRKDSQYPDSQISGAAVGFKFAQALNKEGLVDKDFLRWSLDLVGISVITDMVPLIDENRVFAKYGLMVLGQTKRPGLRALYQKADIERKSIDSYTVGFQIGPRINASGRMNHANHSYYLLMAQDRKQANKLAAEVNQYNKTRQEELEKTLKQARQKIKEKKLDKKKFIVLSDSRWQKGVIGLVANRIKDDLNRPVLLLARDKKYAEGSARSIKNFHILKALESADKHILRYGGHKAAAGLKIKNEKTEELYSDLLEYSENNLTEDSMEPELSIDVEIGFDEVDDNLWQSLLKLEPYGVGNPKPLFLTKNVKVKNYYLVGRNNNHLKLNLIKDKVNLDAIGFDLKEKAKLIKNIGQKVDIVYSIDKNNFGGREKLDLHIKDLKTNG